MNGTGTTIVAGTPATTAGKVDVRVITPGGTSATTAADKYTYLAPAITKVTPGRGAKATKVTITGKDFSGATKVLFGTMRAAGFLVNRSSPGHTPGTQITVAAPAHAAGTVNVRVTTPGGTSAVTVADRFTYT